MSGERVPFNDLRIVGTELEAAIESALRRVLDRSWYILGPEVEAFEEEFASMTGSAHAIGVATGTDAITLALAALGVSAGDEVVTSPMTAAFTATGISRAGAAPVFADIDPDTLTLSAEAVEAKLSERTKAIVPVHLYGNASEMASLTVLARERGLHIVEDAAQAHGARLDGQPLGSLGAAGAFSFYPTKNLGALGDGGMVITNREDLAETIRRLRNGGQSARYVHEEVGFNSRLDEIQAAVLRTKLPHLEGWNERRRALARVYVEALRGAPVEPVALTPGCESARHLMVVRCERRDDLMVYLEQRGIQTLVHYPIPTHLQEAYREIGGGEGSCPVAERAAKTVLSLPLYPSMSEESVARTAGAVRDFYAAS